MITCPNCGTPTMPGGFCTVCGSRLDGMARFGPVQAKNRWMWPLVAVAILAIAGVGVGVFLITRGDHQPTAAAAVSTPTEAPSAAMPTTSTATRQGTPHVRAKTPVHKTRVRTKTKTVIAAPPPAAPAAPVSVDPMPYMDASNAYFDSPSQNIECAILNDGSNSAACVIARYYWDEPGPDCSSGAIVQVDTYGTSSFVGCASSPVYPNGRVLPYGYSLTNGQFTCASAENGVSCTNRDTGTGFTLSRETFTRY
jgi:hypothetical protein